MGELEMNVFLFLLYLLEKQNAAVLLWNDQLNHFRNQ